MPSVKDDLPELPELPPRGYGNEGHTDEAMQSYARLAVQQAVLVERERLLVRFGDRMQGVGISKSDREYILEGLAAG